MHGAFAFLYPKEAEPYFKNNLVQVTRNAAHLVTAVFKRLVNPKRQPQPIPREAAQKFILRCVTPNSLQGREKPVGKEPSK